MRRKIATTISILLIASIFIPCVYAIDAKNYPDVPTQNWAAADIYSAQSAGIMNGNSDGSFGFGKSLKRSEFVAMLVRLFAWEKETVTQSSFTDVSADSWFLSDVETALNQGAIEKTAKFRPEESITREEMAIMLTAALGYSNLSPYTAKYGNPFTDVTENTGMITLAYDFGIINGITPTTFNPKGNAKREEAAAMMMRLYRKVNSQVDFSTGFYAVSAASQMDLIPDFSTMCYGWGRMEYDGETVYVNTTRENNNDWYTPSGYETPLNLAKKSNTPALLAIYMDLTQKQNDIAIARTIFSNSALINQAVSSILDKMNANGYSGICLDFEAFKGQELKDGYNQFIKALSAELKAQGKLLYVTVPPAVYQQSYFDGYDYKTIASYADKVILMAYDYEATSLTDTYMSMGYTTTPLTPFEQVYYSLKVFLDKNTGVPSEKAVLGLCFDSAQWKLIDGKVINRNPFRPSYAAIEGRISQENVQITYHPLYRNPYATFYNAEDGTQNVLWYEDTRSFQDKITLAKLFGVTGISTWRLGQIPNGSGLTYFNFWNEIYK